MDIGMTDKTGGPAFPTVMIDKPEGGMTLRDYFAAKVMVAFIDKDQWQSTVGEISDIVAFNAYAMADAMLKAREL
jgi:hypothetical protein